MKKQLKIDEIEIKIEITNEEKIWRKKLKIVGLVLDW